MDIDAFIDRWSQARGGAERANYQMFLSELCAALGHRSVRLAGPKKRLKMFPKGRARTLRLALPHDVNSPTACLEQFDVPLVARDVAPELLLPET